jgi:glycosyltransferase involved in cell wall biosynthesis
MPHVSVILPAFNRVQYLRAAVESVFAQSYVDWELVIADDGSDEETRGYLRSLASSRVRTLLLPHRGNPSLVRNVAVRAARGRYVAFLDSDDLWAPMKLAKQIDALGDGAERGWSYTGCDLIDASGRHLAIDSRSTPGPTGWIFEAVLRLQVSISMATVVAERELIEAIGAFDEQQLFAEWQDLCLRLALRSEAAALSEVLCSVRLHAEHYSGDRVAAQMGWMRLYEKMMQLAPSPALRSYCERMRAESSLNVARCQGEQGDYRAVLNTLATSMPFGWRYPHWWWGAATRFARPAVPAFLRERLGRARSKIPSR